MQSRHYLGLMSQALQHNSIRLAPPVRRLAPRAPQAITRSPNGSWVFDFGVNQAMQCVLRIETDGSLGGTALRLHHQETIGADGAVVEVPVRVESEAEVFALLGVDYRPPEKREM